MNVWNSGHSRTPMTVPTAPPPTGAVFDGFDWYDVFLVPVWLLMYGATLRRFGYLLRR